MFVRFYNPTPISQLCGTLGRKLFYTTFNQVFIDTKIFWTNESLNCLINGTSYKLVFFRMIFITLGRAYPIQSFFLIILLIWIYVVWKDLSQRRHNPSIFSGISKWKFLCTKLVLSDMVVANQWGEEFMPIFWLAIFNLGLKNAPITQKYKENRFFVIFYILELAAVEKNENSEGDSEKTNTIDKVLSHG